MSVPALEFPGSAPGTTQELALVPDLAGVEEAVAVTTLNRSKLKSELVTLTGEGDPGKVVAQDPAARSVVPQNTVVRVFVLAAPPAGEGGGTEVLAKLAELATSVTAVKDDVAAVKGDVTAVQGDVTTVKGDVSTIRGDVSTVKEDVSAIKDKVVGGGVEQVRGTGGPAQKGG